MMLHINICNKKSTFTLDTVYSTCNMSWCKIIFNFNDSDLHLWTFKFRIFILPFTKEHLFNVKCSHLLFFENHITVRPMDTKDQNATNDVHIERWPN